MGFVKIISYANTLEVYEYERDVVVLGGGRVRTRKTDSSDDDVAIGGEDTLQEGQSRGKREDNARRASLAFRRIVASNLGGSARPILVTLTYRDNYTNLNGAYRHYSAFNQSLRYKYGKAFKYICVPEFQKRGAVHFHALYWGLPEEVFLLERETRTLARLWRQGFVYLKETDGDEKLSHYLTKYMAKAFIDPRLKNQKCYTASKNVLRPLIQTGSFNVPTVLEEFGITSDPVVDREYLTNWLGMGRYRVFKYDKS